MFGKNTHLFKGLAIVSATILFVYGLSYVPAIYNKLAVHTIHDTVFKYIPHRAPDSAYLGKYEGVKGPFVVPLNGTTDVIVEDQHWSVDLQKHKYTTAAAGYMHVKQEDGSYEDVPIQIYDTSNYDTLRTQLPASRHLPVAAAPVAKKLPDSIHGPSPSLEEEAKNLWKKLRKVKLPYTYMAGGSMELTITGRKVSTETRNDSIFLKTTLTAMARYIDRKSPPEPVTMEETEPVE